MSTEHQTEFDYALPWWRRIVEVSLIIGDNKVYLIKEDSMERLNDSAKRLFARFQNSPFWPLMKDEPEIKDLLNSLREVESQCKVENEKKG